MADVEKIAKSTGRRGSMPGERRGGRKKGVPNKATAEIKAIAQSYAPEAIAQLARLMMTSESDQARVAAIKELLDRGYGRAAQAMTGEGGEGPVKVVIEWPGMTNRRLD